MRRSLPLWIALSSAVVAPVAAVGEDAPSAAVRLPRSTDFRLPNGMRVFLVPDHEVPLVTFEVRLGPGGGRGEPDGTGAAALFAALLGKGAGERDAATFQEAVEFEGGSFAAAASPRWVTVEAEFLAEDVPIALELLGDALLRPRLSAREFEKERGLALDALRSDKQEPDNVVARYFVQWALGGHPWGRPTSGTETSLAALTHEDVRSVARALLAPDNAWMAVSGDFDPARMRAAIEERFGGWRSEPRPARSAPNPPGPGPGGPRVLLVDKPDALQTYFRFGGDGIDWSHPDYPARHVANTVLGGSFTSRLNRALRIEGGLTYGAGSGFDDALAGLFSVRTFTETATSEEAMELARTIYERFLADGITQAELDAARNYVKGQFAPDTVETAAQAAHLILALEFEGLPREVVDRFFPRLDALTVDEVNRVIREGFPGGALQWVVIGRAAALRELVARYGEVTEIPISHPGFGP